MCIRDRVFSYIFWYGRQHYRSLFSLLQFQRKFSRLLLKHGTDGSGRLQDNIILWDTDKRDGVSRLCYILHSFPSCPINWRCIQVNINLINLFSLLFIHRVICLIFNCFRKYLRRGPDSRAVAVVTKVEQTLKSIGKLQLCPTGNMCPTRLGNHNVTLATDIRAEEKLLQTCDIRDDIVSTIKLLMHTKN